MELKNKHYLEDENRRLNERLRILASEKSHYQLVSGILTEIAKAQGLENIALQSVFSIMNALGGMNVLLYYRTEKSWYCCDVSSGLKEIDVIDDPLVQNSIDEGIFIEENTVADPGSEMILEGIVNNIQSWVYPLKSGKNVFGAVKMEGIFHKYSDDIMGDLPMITTFIASALWNEISSSGKLYSAYESLKEEMEKRTQNELLYRNTIESSFDGFWIVDKTGKFIEVNEAYCSMTGYSKSRMLDMWIPDIEVFDSSADVEQRMLRIMKSGRERFETKHRCRDGSIIDVEVNTTYSPYIAETFFVFIRDISWRKKEEAERIALEKQLQNAQKAEAIGTLAGGIAHDFNNLLVPLIGYSELLLRELPEKSRAHKRVAQMLKASERARDLVSQILVFNRKNDEEREIVDISEVVRDAVNLLSSTIPKSTSIRLESGKNNIMISADPSKIHQVVINLVVNAYHAVKEIPGGKITIAFSEKRVLSEKDEPAGLIPGDYAVLKISDNGMGIDKSTLSKIFDPYFTTKQRGKGTGLGLAVVQGIVRSYEGGIYVESTPGTGSDFYVYFPVYRKDLCSFKESSGDLYEGNISGKGNILLVDDEEYILDIESVILEELGYSVVPVNDTGRAVEIFRKSEKSFDLLITDMTMPVLSGVDLAGELRKINPSLPVIICTGYSEIINPQNKDLFGIDEVLMKPLGHNILAETVKKILSAE